MTSPGQDREMRSLESLPAFNTHTKGGSIWGHNIRSSRNRDARNNIRMVSHNNKEQEYILHTLLPKEATPPKQVFPSNESVSSLSPLLHRIPSMESQS